MKFIFVSEPTFEHWDWTNPDTQGIGGSETSHIEMARRLAARGHAVLSYAPVPFEEPRWNEGVLWRHFDQIDYAEPCDVWVIYRAPHVLDNLPDGVNAWLIFQDVDYRFPKREFTEERANKLTRAISLCPVHCSYLKLAHPYAAAKVFQSSNGIKRELIERKKLENTATRNPCRLMYPSSPDRGLVFLLDIFPRAREVARDLELHVYYGFDNIDKVVERAGPEHWITRNARMLKEKIDQPGVIDHGRTPQPQLIEHWLESGIWCHPTNFTETSCITSMDAQACGAIPITKPLWAVADNVQHGVLIDGDASNELIQARYTLELIRMACQPELQEEIRSVMMPWALDRFGWETIAGQWEQWAREDPALATEAAA